MERYCFGNKRFQADAHLETKSSDLVSICTRSLPSLDSWSIGEKCICASRRIGFYIIRTVVIRLCETRLRFAINVLNNRWKLCFGLPKSNRDLKNEIIVPIPGIVLDLPRGREGCRDKGQRRVVLWHLRWPLQSFYCNINASPVIVSGFIVSPESHVFHFEIKCLVDIWKNRTGTIPEVDPDYVS